MGKYQNVLLGNMLEEVKGGAVNQFMKDYDKCDELGKAVGRDIIKTINSKINRREEIMICQKTFEDLFKSQNDVFPVKYIVYHDPNKDKATTVLFWADGDKTEVKKDKFDIFDKEFGVLYGFFVKWSGHSKNKRKKILSMVKPECLKDYLKEHFVARTGMTTDKVNKYLANLFIEEEDEILNFDIDLDFCPTCEEPTPKDVMVDTEGKINGGIGIICPDCAEDGDVGR